MLTKKISNFAVSTAAAEGLAPLVARTSVLEMLNHDDVIKWKYFPRNWPFVQGIHRSNNREAGDLRRHRAHYDVIVKWGHSSKIWGSCDVNARGILRRNRSRVYTTWKLSATCNGHGFMACLAATHGVSWLTSIKTTENTVEPLYDTIMFVKNTQKRLWGRVQYVFCEFIIACHYHARCDIVSLSTMAYGDSTVYQVLHWLTWSLIKATACLMKDNLRIISSYFPKQGDWNVHKLMTQFILYINMWGCWLFKN